MSEVNVRTLAKAIFEKVKAKIPTKVSQLENDTGFATTDLQLINFQSSASWNGGYGSIPNGTTNLVMNGTGFLVLSLHITAHSNGILAVSVNGKPICSTETNQSGASSEVNYWSIIPLYLSSGDKVTINMDTNSTNSSYRIFSRF